MFDSEINSTDANAKDDAATPLVRRVSKGGKTKKAKTTKARVRKTRAVAKRQSWSVNVDDPDRFGFFKMKDTPLRTMDDRQYEDILTDEVKWAALETRMNADFNHALDMFPYAEQSDEERLSNVNWIERIAQNISDFFLRFAARHKLTDISLPRRYYAIMGNDIEERFPGGREKGEPGDGDIRDLLTAFRQLFRENLAHYIYKKRLYQILAVVCFGTGATFLLIAAQIGTVILAGGLKNNFSFKADAVITASNAIAAVIIIPTIWYLYRGIIMIFEDRSQIIFDSYNNSQTESCKTLDKQAALRTKNLYNLIVTMAARVDKDESTLDQEIRVDEWPKRAYRWTVVVYWLARRLENLERYTQLQMWRVRRTHYFYRLVASSSNHVTNLINGTAIITISVLVWLFSSFPHHIQVLYNILQAPVQWVYHYLSIAADKAFNVSLPALPSTPPSSGPLWWNQLYDTVVKIPSDPAEFARVAGHWLTESAGNIFYYLPSAFAFLLAWHLLRGASKQSAAKWNTSLLLLTQNMDIRNWDRFHDVNLANLLGSQVRADKNNILRRESWVAGKNR